MAVIKITRTVALDAPILTEALHGTLFTTEGQAHEFTIHCTQGGAAVTLSGTVTAKFIREESGDTILISGSLSSGAAKVTLPADCYHRSGRFSLTVFVTSGSVATVVYACTGTVKAAEDGTLIDQGGVVPSIDQIIQQLAGKVNKSGDTMTGALTFVSNGSFGVDIKTSASGARGLSMRFAEASDAERTYFYQFKADNTHYDLFRLPATATAETSNSNYDILTTRTDVLTVTGANGATVSDNASKRVGTLTMLAFRVTLPSSGTGWVRVATYAEGVLGTVTMYDRVITASGAVAPLQINESGLSVYMSSGLQSQQIIICTTLLL